MAMWHGLLSLCAKGVAVFYSFLGLAIAVLISLTSPHTWRKPSEEDQQQFGEGVCLLLRIDKTLSNF